MYIENICDYYSSRIHSFVHSVLADCNYCADYVIILQANNTYSIGTEAMSSRCTNMMYIALI